MVSNIVPLAIVVFGLASPRLANGLPDTHFPAA